MDQRPTRSNQEGSLGHHRKLLHCKLQKCFLRRMQVQKCFLLQNASSKKCFCAEYKFKKYCILEKKSKFKFKKLQFLHLRCVQWVSTGLGRLGRSDSLFIVYYQYKLLMLPVQFLVASTVLTIAFPGFLFQSNTVKKNG